jgi:hypothetical protein
MGRKVLLIALAVFLKHASNGYSLITVVNILFLLLQLYILPYDKSADNHKENITLVVLTLITALLTQAPQPLPPNYALPLTLLVLVTVAGIGVSIFVRIVGQRLASNSKTLSDPSNNHPTSLADNTVPKSSDPTPNQVASADPIITSSTVTNGSDIKDLFNSFPTVELTMALPTTTATTRTSPMTVTVGPQAEEVLPSPPRISTNNGWVTPTSQPLPPSSPSSASALASFNPSNPVQP